MIEASSDQFAERPGEPYLPRSRFLVIRNSHAGLKSARLTAGVADALAAHGAKVRTVETANAAAVRLALSDMPDLDAVVAAGGDGTVRALALTLHEMGLDLPIGLIPAGTGNVLANEVGLPRKAEPLAQLLIRGPARDVRIMLANEVPFLLMASSGFDAEVLLRLSVSLKQKIARAAYVLPTLSAFAHGSPAPFDVLIDGAQHSATWVIIANARTYGGNFRLVDDVSIFDDRLQAVLFDAGSRAGRLNELGWLAAGRVARCKSVSVIACRRIEILAPRYVPSQIDGDAIGFGPVTIGPSGRTLRLIVPVDAR